MHCNVLKGNRNEKIKKNYVMFNYYKYDLYRQVSYVLMNSRSSAGTDPENSERGDWCASYIDTIYFIKKYYNISHERMGCYSWTTPITTLSFLY